MRWTDDRWSAMPKAPAAAFAAASASPCPIAAISQPSSGLPSIRTPYVLTPTYVRTPSHACASRKRQARRRRTRPADVPTGRMLRRVGTINVSAIYWSPSPATASRHPEVVRQPTSRAMRTDPLAYLGQELESLKEQKLYRQLRILEDEQKAHTTVDHKSVVNLSSNNYLGLTTHPKLRERALEGDRGLRRRHRIGADDRRHHGNPHGARTPARRLQEGREGRRVPERVHGQRRHRLGDPDERRRRHLRRAEPREHHRRLPAEPRDDQGLPAQGRRRGAPDHQGAAGGRSASCSSPTASSAWTATSARCRRLCELAEETGCIMMVDDAHASGVFGKNGRGTIDHFGMHGRVDVQVGHAVEGDRRPRRLRRRQRQPDRLPLSPRAAVPVLDLPSAVGRAGLHGRAGRSDGGAGNHRTVVGRILVSSKRGCTGSGSTPALSESPITPVIAGEGAKAMMLSDKLFERGVFAQGIAFPTVARDKARVRTIVTATHTREDLQYRARRVRGGRPGDRPDLTCRHGPSSRIGVRTALVRCVDARHRARRHRRGSAAAVHARHARRVPVLLARARRGSAGARAVVARGRCCASARSSSRSR